MSEELSLEQVKGKLLKLSAKGLIKKTSFQIKKMNEQNCRIELEKYEQKMVAETAEKIKGIIFDGVSKGLSYMEVIDEEDSKKLENELKTNNYLEEEVINISKSIAPWIPYIGLTLAGITIGRYAYTRYLRHKKEQEHAEAACTTQEDKGSRSSGRSPQRPAGDCVPNKSKENGTEHSASERAEGPDRGVEQNCASGRVEDPEP